MDRSSSKRKREQKELKCGCRSHEIVDCGANAKDNLNKLPKRCNWYLLDRELTKAVSNHSIEGIEDCLRRGANPNTHQHQFTNRTPKTQEETNKITFPLPLCVLCAIHPCWSRGRLVRNHKLGDTFDRLKFFSTALPLFIDDGVDLDKGWHITRGNGKRVIETTIRRFILYAMDVEMNFLDKRNPDERTAILRYIDETRRLLNSN